MLELFVYEGYIPANPDDWIGNIENADVDFTVGEPFPTALIIAISMLLVTAAIVSLLLGLRIHQRKSSTGSLGNSKSAPANFGQNRTSRTLVHYCEYNFS